MSHCDQFGKGFLWAFCHRDIKPENIFLTLDAAKVGDLGLAKILRGGASTTRTVCGTPAFYSPEIWEARPYGKESDVWALG